MTDQRIDFTQSEQYTLSIRLSADGFSFSIYNPLVEKRFYNETYPTDPSLSMAANVKKMLASVLALAHTYQRINILTDTRRFAPVPFDLYEDEQTDTLFHYNFRPMENETILCNILGRSNVVILFGIDAYTHQLLSEHFPTARFFATVSPQTEYFAQKSRTGSNNRRLYANIGENHMEVFAYDKGKLLLINSFDCRQMTDRIYYLLSVWQQLGYDQERDELHLAICPKEGKTLLTELRRYMRQVYFVQRETTVGPADSEGEEKTPFDIQTLILCE